MLFPCMRASSKIAVIDDDQAFLDAMADSIGSMRRCEFLSRPGELDSTLSRQDDLLRQEQRMLLRVSPPAEMALRAGLDYFSWSGRHEIFSVLVADHVMPAETGLSICTRHSHFGLRRVLLTGFVDSEMAVKAHNAGAIDEYLQKQASDLGYLLNTSLQDHFVHNSRDRGRILEMQMEGRQRGLLLTPEISSELMLMLGRSRVDEYIMLADPFGILGLRSDGKVMWIQIETRESLNELCATLDEFGWDKAGVEQVRAGRSLSNIEVVTQIEGVEPSFSPAVVLSDELGLLAAEFVFDSPKTVSWRALVVDGCA